MRHPYSSFRDPRDFRNGDPHNSLPRMLPWSRTDHAVDLRIFAQYLRYSLSQILFALDYVLVIGLLGVGRRGIGRKGFLRRRGSLLREVIGSFQVVADEPHFSGDIAFQQHISIFIRELTMNGDGGGPADGGHVTLQFAALLEACNRGVKSNEVDGASGIPVTVTIDLGVISPGWIICTSIAAADELAAG